MAIDQTVSGISCPCCYGKTFYHLADGRRKCRACGKKFTPHRRQSRLSNGILRQVALYFWHMVPAARVAEELHLNRKSVQRHYRLLRQAICHSPESQPEEPGGGIGDAPAGPTDQEWAAFAVKEPVFALALRGGEVRVLFRPRWRTGCSEGTGAEYEGRVEALFFAASEFALKSGDLTDFYLSVPVADKTVREQQPHLQEVLNFWDFVRRLKKLKRSRHQQGLSLFLRELEFRFNNRNNAQIIEQLTAILQTGGK